MKVNIPQPSSEVILPEPLDNAAHALAERLKVARSPDFVAREKELLAEIAGITKSLAEFRSTREVSAAKKSALVAAGRRTEREFIEAEIAKLESFPIKASELRERALDFLLTERFGDIARRKFHLDRAAIDARLATLFQELNAAQQKLRQHRARVLGQEVRSAE